MANPSTDVAPPKTAFETWTVCAHGDLEELADNLWRVTGSVPRMGNLGRQMTIARMKDGGLVIHNAVALEEEHMRVIEQKGPIRFLVVPSRMHRLDAKVFKDRYPDAKVVCPRGGRATVERVVPVDLTYDAFPGDDTVTLAHVDGVADQEGVLTVRSSNGATLVFNDLIFNLPHQPGFSGLLVRLMGSSGGPRVTRLARAALVKDKRRLRAALEALAGTPELRRIIPGHGDVIYEDPSATLSAIAARL